MCTTRTSLQAGKTVVVSLGHELSLPLSNSISRWTFQYNF